MSFNFIKYRKIYYFFSGILVLGSIASLVIFGLNFGIDFTGGSILELAFENRPENQAIQDKLKDLNFGEITIQPAGEKGVILRLKDIPENTHQEIISKLGEISKIEEKRFESIGPVVGRELRQKTLILVVLAIAALLTYIAISFRKVSQTVSGLKYGIVSIIALCFDVIVPIGVFAILGKFYNVQFNIPIVTALLTILGYAINDKIIIFDRIRENLLKGRGLENFRDLVNQSLNQTIIRSLSTGSCTFLVLCAIFFLGGETLKYFALTLMIGILAGTYSSLFLASPLLASWVMWRRK